MNKQKKYTESDVCAICYNCAKLDEVSLEYQKNFWFGTSINCDEDGMLFNDTGRTFLSIEPIMSNFEQGANGFFGVNWVIVGAETGNRKNKVIPKKEWIENIVSSCRKNEIPVFLKNSLKDIWGDDLIQEFPFEKEGKC
jgi:protein gp37